MNALNIIIQPSLSGWEAISILKVCQIRDPLLKRNNLQTKKYFLQPVTRKQACKKFAIVHAGIKTTCH